jgi:GTP-binding protein EngB required for normal cell division
MTLETPQHPEGLWADAPAPDISLLTAYTRAKQSIARSIRAIQNRVAKLKREDIAAPYQELMVKLAEDRFTLAVLGQFKRGKSSLMNAIIGRELLPTGVLPLTSAITVLRYGPAERLVVIREDALFPEELPTGRLAEFVTERGNPGNVKRIKVARVEVPLAFLRHGLEFVDTPGVGSSIEANTATTYQFLPQCDAAIFVTSVDSPLSKTELEFLAGVRQHVRKVFFVVNKIDLLSPAEREDVLEYVRDSLAHLPQDQRVSLFPASARHGLQAKQTGSAEGYGDSGLRSLEEALAAFLATEKAATFLDSVLDKAIRLLPGAMAMSDAPAATDGFWQNMRQRLLAMKSRLRDRLQEPEPPSAGDLRPEETGLDLTLTVDVSAAT